MDSSKLPDRIKAKLTIDLDFAKEDQPLIFEVLQGIIDNLGMSSTGSGSRTAQSHYSYKLESNTPPEPMTVDRMLSLMDQEAEPGEATASERIAETMHPDYDQAQEWWSTLSEAQRTWALAKYSDVKLVTKMWDKFKAMDFADKVFFKTLNGSN